jgi:hypothetical protein
MQLNFIKKLLVQKKLAVLQRQTERNLKINHNMMSNLLT